MTKKDYIHALGSIGESMAMCTSGCAWRGSVARRDFTRK